MELDKHFRFDLIEQPENLVWLLQEHHPVQPRSLRLPAASRAAGAVLPQGARLLATVELLW